MSTPLAVLLVEDSESDAQLILRLLRKAGYQLVFERVETGPEMQRVLAQRTWDIVLSDYNLPQFNTLQALELLHNSGQDLPFLLISGAIGEESAVEMMRAGAHDYLSKNNLARLAPAVEREITQARIRRERKQADEILRVRLQMSECALSCSLDELLRKLLDEIERLTASEIGFFHFVEPDQATVSLQAWSSNTLQKMCQAQGAELHYPIAEAGVWIDCIQQRQVVIHNDYASLPHRKGLPEGHAPLARELLVPVFRADRIVAVLGVGNKAQDYSAEDAQTVSLLADLAWDFAERKQIQEKLRQSETQYRLLAEHMTDTVWLMDLNFKTTYISPSVERTRGYSLEELQKMQLNEHLTPASFQLLAELMMVEMPKVFADPTYTPVHSLDLEFYRKDGSTLWSENKINVIRDAQGQPVAFLGEARDISERKKAQDELRRYAFIVNTAPELMTLVNRDYRFEAVNDAYCRARGESRADLIGRSLAEVWGEDLYRAKIQPHLDRCFEGQATTNEDVFAFPGIDPRIYQVGMYPYAATPGGPVSHTVIVTFDITERKKAEEALRESEALYQDLVETSQDLIWQCNEQSCYTYLNPAWEQVFGYRLHEMLGKKFTDFISPETAVRDSQQFAALLQGGVVKGYETTHLGKNGQKIDLVFNAKSFTDERGVISGVRGAAYDITERKRAEEALRASLTEKEVLLKEVHHRVKNNLQIIYSLLDMQADTAQDARIALALEESKNRVRVMSLIHEKLYRSQNLEFIRASEYIPELLDHLAVTFADLTGEVNFEVEIADLTFGLNTAIPCGMIITELVTNALKYAFPERRPGTLRVQITSSQGSIRLLVSDDGIGLPASSSLHEPETLGLELVRILTSQLKGSLEVIHEPGTTFLITFPETLGH